MASNLTAEQRARIELNRKIALEKRATKLKNLSESKKSSSLLSLEVNSSSSNANNTQPTNQGRCPTLKRNLQSPEKDNPNYSTLNIKHVKSTGSSTQPQAVKSSPIKTKILRQLDPISGVFKLLSAERFTVDMPYHQPTIDVFRTITGKEYSPNSRQWTFPLNEYFSVRKAVSVLRPHVIIVDLPKWVVETFINKAKSTQLEFKNIDLSRINDTLLQTLYPYQKEGIQFGVSRSGRCLIADDMGLGKSIQALGIADYYRNDWPLLIVCPSSMRYQWEEEIRIHLPGSVHTHQVFVLNSAKDTVYDPKVLIMSYDLLLKKTDLVKEMKFGVVIIDESHSIKSSKSQRSKAALEVSQICRRVILLSGTPALSRPSELYPQIKAVDPTIFPFFKEYGIRYCDGKETKFGWNFSGFSNMEELKLLLEARFMIRRLKSSVLTQLPSKIRHVVVLKNQSLSKKNESMDEYALRLQSSLLKGTERHGMLLSYFSETSKLKAPAVCEYIADLLKVNDSTKFLCFAHHAEMLDKVCEMLESNKTYYIRIDGSVSAEDRKSLCDKFQLEGRWRVAVLSIKAANTGLTLTAAQIVIFAELFWNPGDLVQAEDRAHRIGQEDCVVVKYLIAKGTADDYLWPLIESKLEVLNKAGLSKDSYMTADTKCIQQAEEVKVEKQTKINEYFINPFDDREDQDLLKVMDEIEGVGEKRKH